MALEIQPSEMTGKAASKVKDFDVAYTFKHEVGSKPDVIRARATKEDSKEVFDVTLYLKNGNLQSTVHYSSEETDLSILEDIVKEIYEIYNSI